MENLHLVTVGVLTKCPQSPMIEALIGWNTSQLTK